MPHDHNHDLVWTNTMLWYIYYKIQIYTILYQHHVESDLFTLNKSLKVCWSLVSLLLINNNKSKTKTKTWSWSEPHWTYLPASKIQWHLTVKQLKERLDSYRYGDRTTKCKSIVAADFIIECGTSSFIKDSLKVRGLIRIILLNGCILLIKFLLIY